MNDYRKADLSHPYLQKIVGETNFPDPPKELWIRGKLPEHTGEKDRPKTVAIVGARRSTGYGEDIAYKLAFDLARCGVVIVSGMAYGIDSCAHRGCLDAGGITIAVLGTPIDQIYPRSNIGLAKRILEKGAIISEYEPNFETKNYCFLQRNRIVTGLSDAVVVVEASQKSGTKYTALVGDRQNRKVFAVPGDITRPMSAGCNQLIYDGVCPCLDVLDVMAAIGVYNKGSGNKIAGLDASEKLVVEAIKGGANEMLDIIKQTKYSSVELMQILMELELKSAIKSSGNNRWTLA